MLAVLQLALIVSVASSVMPRVRANEFCVLTAMLLATLMLAAKAALALCTDSETLELTPPKLQAVMVLITAWVLAGTVYTVVSVLALGFDCPRILYVVVILHSR